MAEELESAPPFHIRRATLADAGAVSQVAATVQQLHFERDPTTFQPPDVEAGVAWYRELLARPDTVAFLAESDAGAPMGHVLTIARSIPVAAHFTHPQEYVEVQEIGVLPAHRGTGVGRALHQRAVAHWRAAGVTELRLTVIAFNDGARRFYEGLGFVERSRKLSLRLE